MTIGAARAGHIGRAAKRLPIDSGQCSWPRGAARVAWNIAPPGRSGARRKPRPSPPRERCPQSIGKAGADRRDALRGRGSQPQASLAADPRIGSPVQEDLELARTARVRTLAGCGRVQAAARTPAAIAARRLPIDSGQCFFAPGKAASPPPEADPPPPESRPRLHRRPTPPPPTNPLYLVPNPPPAQAVHAPTRRDASEATASRRARRRQPSISRASSRRGCRLIQGNVLRPGKAASPSRSRAGAGAGPGRSGQGIGGALDAVSCSPPSESVASVARCGRGTGSVAGVAWGADQVVAAPAEVAGHPPHRVVRSRGEQVLGGAASLPSLGSGRSLPGRARARQRLGFGLPSAACSFSLRRR